MNEHDPCGPQLFAVLESLLEKGESLQFHVERHARGVRVMVIPKLSDAPKDMPKEIEPLRAVLVRPLVLESADGQALDRDFINVLRRYGEGRESARSAVDDLLDALRETGKAARVAKEEKTRKEISQPVRPAADDPAPSPAAEADAGAYDDTGSESL